MISVSPRAGYAPKRNPEYFRGLPRTPSPKNPSFLTGTNEFNEKSRRQSVFSAGSATSSLSSIEKTGGRSAVYDSPVFSTGNSLYSACRYVNLQARVLNINTEERATSSADSSGTISTREDVQILNTESTGRSTASQVWKTATKVAACVFISLFVTGLFTGLGFLVGGPVGAAIGAGCGIVLSGAICYTLYGGS